MKNVQKVLREAGVICSIFFFKLVLIMRASRLKLAYF